MTNKLFAGILGTGLAIAPALLAQEPKKKTARSDSESSDIQSAIQFERHKEAAAAREWRKEGNRDATFENRAEADRSASESTANDETRPATQSGKQRARQGRQTSDKTNRQSQPKQQ